MCIPYWSQQGQPAEHAVVADFFAWQIIRVQTVDGQSRIECADTNTLADFKGLVQQQCGIRTWDQQYSRDPKGRQPIPDDGRSLRSLNITCAVIPPV